MSIYVERVALQRKINNTIFQRKDILRRLNNLHWALYLVPFLDEEYVTALEERQTNLIIEFKEINKNYREMQAEMEQMNKWIFEQRGVYGK